MKKLLSSLSTGVLGLVVAAQAHAQANYLSEVGSTAGLSENDLPTVIGQLVNVLLSLLGIIFLILIIISGFQWMTAGGDEGKVDKAKTRIQQAVIGLIITLAAFAISQFVFEALSNAGFDTNN